MDPDTRVMFMPDGRRLTPMRVAGFALELAFRVGHFLGLWELGPPRVALVKVKKVSMGRPENHPRAVECSVAEVHQRAVIKATEDIMPRLTKSGYAIVDVCVSQKGHDAAHDLVLEYRTPGTPCRGQYAGELKLRTSPAHRTAMRKDCASLFKAACDDSDKWLGQLIIVAEVTGDGEFIRSRAELVVRGCPRTEPVNVWGWEGRPCVAPPQQGPSRARMSSIPYSSLPTPPLVSSSPKVSWAKVVKGMKKYTASWAEEDVVKFSDFFVALEQPGRSKNSDRILQSCQKAPCLWKLGIDFGRAGSREEGRVKQGGANRPYMVKLSSLKRYHDTL